MFNPPHVRKFLLRLTGILLTTVVASAVGCAARPTFDAAVDVVAVDSSETGSCTGSLTDCSGACVDLLTSSEHCGRCGRACASGQRCEGGACVTMCPPGQMACGTLCVDVSRSSAHCGRCSSACASGELCRVGMCLANSCPAPRSICADECVDLASSPMNCGMCGRACMMGESCSGGTCTTAFVETGRSCGDNAACGMNGRCITAALGWRNGYCTYPCGSMTMPCDSVGVCLNFGAGAQCMRRCIDDGDCRSGYTCLSQGGVRVCMPRCTNAPEVLCGENRCDTFSEQCTARSCMINSDCSTGSVCNLGTRFCACTAMTNCGTNRACIMSTGRCGCANNAACPPGQTCNTMTGNCM